jgi:hypothetical protein
MSLRLVVGARMLPTSPPRGSAINISKIGGGRCRASSIASQGPAIDFFEIVGGHSRTSDITSQGAHSRCPTTKWYAFLDLWQCLSGATMVDTMSQTFFSKFFSGSLHCYGPGEINYNKQQNMITSFIEATKSPAGHKLEPEPYSSTGCH